ncbi:response regulator [Synechococcus elongatus IITB7]|uniref:response regulator n=1 Tax=Synechococcus elongatus TaxID=32046 RepID=UPI0030D2DA3C
MSESLESLALLAHWRHELRTPINAILGYSQLLIEDWAGTAIAADLERIEAAGQDLLRLVNEILDPQSSDRALSLDDYQSRLRYALRTPVNTVCGYVELLLEEAPPELAESQTDLNRIRAAGERLLAQLEAMAAWDQPAQPATVALSAVEVEMAEAVLRYRQADSLQPAIAGGRLLVADDNEINRDVLQRRLSRLGHDVICVASGQEALTLLAQEPFDLLFLDVMMPGLTGFEVLQKLKADPTLAELPVLMISALDDLESVIRCLRLGATDYLTKPFEPTLLQTRLETCLERKRLRDRELDYLRNVAIVTDAAVAVEAGDYDRDRLQTVAERNDALGQLARMFRQMTRSVEQRETQLKQTIQRLELQIDTATVKTQVQEITESDYFRNLESRARQIRRDRGYRSPPRDRHD